MKMFFEAGLSDSPERISTPAAVSPSPPSVERAGSPTEALAKVRGRSVRSLSILFEHLTLLLSVPLILCFAPLLNAAEERATIEGRVINTNGLPLADAMVFVHFAVPRDSKPTINPTCYPDCGKHTRSDAQGNFKLEGLSPDYRFRLLVSAKGHLPDYVKNVDPLFSSALAKLKPLKLGNTLPENRIVGKLLDPEGRPVPGAAININASRRGSSTTYGSSSGRYPSLVVSDERGEFAIDCASDITALLALIEPRALAKRHVWLETGKAHLIRLKEGAVVTGRLLKDGEAIPGAMISMSTQDRDISSSIRGIDVATDAKGYFTITNVPADNRFNLHTQMKDMRGLGVALPMQPVTTGPDGTKVELGELVTKPSHIIQGRVVLADGKPIPSRTRIYLNLDEAYDSQDLVLGPDGEFEFGGVPQEVIEMSVRISGYRISAKNPNKDWLNEGQLIGRLERDLQDFVIHLESGPRLNSDQAPTDAERQPRDKALRGATL